MALQAVCSSAIHKWAGLALVIACWAACGSGLSAAETAADPRPAARNVVLIISDDQHWCDYGFMGHKHLRTPHLDRLARESLVYRFGHVPSSLCCPSLASIITGRLPHEHRIVGNDPPEDPRIPRNGPEGRAAFIAGREAMNRHLEEWPLLPRLLADRGYESLQTGKWWQGDFARGGFTQGMSKGQRHGDEGLTIGRQSLQPVYDFIGRCRDDGRPFFVWYAPMLPHDPHDPPQELVDHYAARTDSLHVARYWGNVERFDRTVGDLLEHLDRERLARDTLVIYVTDNGWIQSPDRPQFAPRSKLSPYEGGLRTPIMLRQPGTIPPGTSDALASSIDIMPTVLAACGVPAPAGLPGVDLLDAKAVAERRQIFGECFTHTLVDLDDPVKSLLWRWTIRDDEQTPHQHRWKLIVPTSATTEATIGGDAGGEFPAGPAGRVDPHSRQRWQRREIELFDLAADPDETKNLAVSKPTLVKELTQSLVANWSPHGSPHGLPHGPRAAAATPPAAAGAKRPPNLLVFLADDLGAHDLGCTGSTFYRTPAIDRLAASGMLFTRGYAAAPVCSPTRAALMTGRYPARVRITNFIGGSRRGSLLPADYLHALPASELTVPDRLHAAGYATGIFGKWHLGPPKDIPSHGFDVTGSTHVGPDRGPPDDTHHARAIAAEASAFITANRDQPFFCYVPMHSVHVPLNTRADLLAEEQARVAALSPPAGPREVAEGDRKARAVQDHPVYAGMIREMDETVATVLAAVEAAGQTDNTLVIFTSDNGGLSTAEGSPTSNLPLRAGKGFLYEGGIRVPLVVRWPGIVKPGTTTVVPATTLDIAATLLDVGGTTQPVKTVLDGTSLRPVLAGGTLPARDLCWHYPHYANQGGRPTAAIIAGDGPSQGTEKLVEHFEDGRVELFDLATDPGERRDLAAERPERAAALKERLAAWRAAVGAVMPSPNPQPVDPFGPEGEPRKR